MATQSQSVRSADVLQAFQLNGVRDTGIIVGDGSYATVKELDFRGLKCVGKKIHALLYELATPHEKADLLRRFAVECELLSGLHHPCIVQFLGVFYSEEGSTQLPVMVMEYLHTTLSSCLERYGVLPEELSYGILLDVALGLRYLHEHLPPIIHRDLSANNVLLSTGMSAKISDLGVAKILNLTPAMITQRMSTQTPGTPCYMPPEALVSRPSYTSKIDSYSYGVLMIHVLCGRWPFPEDAFRPDPGNPTSFVPVSEVDRRAEYIQEIGLEHPMIGLIQRCLSNSPPLRPEAAEIVPQVEIMISRYSPSFENKVEMIQQIGTLRKTQNSAAEGLIREIESKSRENESQIREIESLRSDNMILRRQLESIVLENGFQRSQILSLREQLSISLQMPPAIEPATIGQTPLLIAQSNPPSHHRESEVLMPAAEARLQWRRCTDLPLEVGSLQSILVKGSIYVGGGVTKKIADYHVVFQYDLGRDGWYTLPPCPVRGFALGQFQGHLITVGGVTLEEEVTGKVYRFREAARVWEEYLKPMLTPRSILSIATTPSAIIACGGEDDEETTYSVVETYTVQTSQWRTAESLPFACSAMTSVTIGDTFYLLGGQDEHTKAVLCAAIPSLLKTAKSPTLQRSTSAPRITSVWKTLPATPLRMPTATSLGGRLLALGGVDDDEANSQAVNMYLPSTNSWVRMPSGDLPVAVYAATSVELPNSKLLICGGCDDAGKLLKTMYMGYANV